MNLMLLFLLLSVQAVKIHLVTQFPPAATPQRTHEYLYCLDRNLNLPEIHKVHLVTANLSLPNHSKLVFHKGIADMTITSALRLAFNHTQENDIIIIVNADIYFDQTVRYLRYMRSSPWFLSRYEHYPLKGPLYIGTQCDSSRYIGSHDAFIFRRPMPTIWLSVLDWALGTPGMEARMIWELAQFGVKVENPCTLVRTWHVHYSKRNHRYRFPVVNTFKRSMLAWPK